MKEKSRIIRSSVHYISILNMAAIIPLVTLSFDTLENWFKSADRQSQVYIASLVIVLGLSGTLRWLLIIFIGFLWIDYTYSIPGVSGGVMPYYLTLPVMNIILALLVATQVFRFIEINYGPRNIPDVKKHYKNLAYFRAQCIRKVRQSFEMALYTIYPAHFCTLILLNNDDDLDGPYRLPWFVCICFACGIIQKVFGVNPSHKASILDQYGNSIPSVAIGSNNSQCRK